MQNRYLVDATYASTEGLFSSKLYAENSLLYYIVDLAAVGCSGHAKFSFGLATDENLETASGIVNNFEDALINLTYTVKHSYIDNIYNFDRLTAEQPLRVKKFLPNQTYQLTEGAFTAKIYTHDKHLSYVVLAVGTDYKIDFDFLYSVATAKKLKSLKETVKEFEIALLNVVSDLQSLGSNFVA